jgi:hypothetical protein
MTKQAIVAVAIAAAMGLSAVAVTDVARADGIFNGMNPVSWFFGRDRDDYYDRDYRYRPSRWGGPYGWGDPYGWNGPWGLPAYGAPQTVIVVPGQSADATTKLASVHLPE